MSQPCQPEEIPQFKEESGDVTNSHGTPNSIQESSDSCYNSTPQETMIVTEIRNGVLPMLKVESVKDAGASYVQRVQFSVERPVLTEQDLMEDYDGGPRKLKSPKERLRMMRDKYRCSVECSKKMLQSFFPFLGIMKAYNLKKDLIGDLVAGLTVGIMQIPQGEAALYLYHVCGSLSQLKKMIGKGRAKNSEQDVYPRLG